MADADKPQKPPPSTTKKKTKAQTAAMKEQMAKMQKLLQAQRQSLELNDGPAKQHKRALRRTARKASLRRRPGRSAVLPRNISFPNNTFVF